MAWTASSKLAFSSSAPYLAMTLLQKTVQTGDLGIQPLDRSFFTNGIEGSTPNVIARQEGSRGAGNHFDAARGIDSSRFSLFISHLSMLCYIGSRVPRKIVTLMKWGNEGRSSIDYANTWCTVEQRRSCRVQELREGPTRYATLTREWIQNLACTIFVSSAPSRNPTRPRLG